MCSCRTSIDSMPSMNGHPRRELAGFRSGLGPQPAQQGRSCSRGTAVVRNRNEEYRETEMPRSPSPSSEASHRAVRLLPAGEAEGGPALAGDVQGLVARLPPALHCKGAPRGRAPGHLPASPHPVEAQAERTRWRSECAGRPSCLQDKVNICTRSASCQAPQRRRCSVDTARCVRIVGASTQPLQRLAAMLCCLTACATAAAVSFGTPNFAGAPVVIHEGAQCKLVNLCRLLAVQHLLHQSSRHLCNIAHCF